MKKGLGFILLLIILIFPEKSLGYDLSDLAIYLKGATIIAQDSENMYLGKILNKYNSDSIFNEYSNYGSEYSSKSIWNKYSKYGNKYGNYSAFNKFSRTPPMLIKNGKVIAYLSTNSLLRGSVSPYLLKSLEDML